jgi:ribosomal protein L35AE/L33A
MISPSQTYTLLSVDNVVATRSECKRILENLGVFIVLENADGNTILKCRVEELFGATCVVSVQFQTNRG